MDMVVIQKNNGWSFIATTQINIKYTNKIMKEKDGLNNMVAKKKSDETTEIKEEKVEKPKTINKATLEKENDDLKKEMSEMKAMMEEMKQFMATQQTQSEVDNKAVKIEKAKPKIAQTIELDRIIEIVNTSFGRSLSLKTANDNLPLEFPEFGFVQQVTYKELRDILSKNLAFAKEPRFFIRDEEVVDALRLSLYYKNFVDVDELENAYSLPSKELEKLLDRIPEYQRYVIYRFTLDRVMRRENIDLTNLDIIARYQGVSDLNSIAQMYK